MTKIFILCLFLATALSQNDQDIPTWLEIRKVLDYKESGAAAILYETRLSSKILNADATDDLTSLDKDSTAFVWMKFLLPKNLTEERFTLVIKKGPIPVMTSPLKLSLKSNNGALVYRTWRSHKFTKAGNYTIEIYFEELLVKEMTLKVNN